MEVTKDKGEDTSTSHSVLEEELCDKTACANSMHLITIGIDLTKIVTKMDKCFAGLIMNSFISCLLV